MKVLRTSKLSFILFLVLLLPSMHASVAGVLEVSECDFCTNVVSVANSLFVLDVDPDLVTGAVSLMCFLFPSEVEELCETLGQDVAQAVADEYDGSPVDVQVVCSEILQVC